MDQHPTTIQLDVILLTTAQGQCQTLTIDFAQPQKQITPQEMAQVKLPQNLDLNREVIIFGPAPIWLYGRLCTLCRTAPWIACYDIR
ncbi:MAG: CRISPR-associated protein Csx3, partial [Leptolyngbyaceae cyanobacterium]